MARVHAPKPGKHTVQCLSACQWRPATSAKAHGQASPTVPGRSLHVDAREVMCGDGGTSCHAASFVLLLAFTILFSYCFKISALCTSQVALHFEPKLAIEIALRGV